MSFAYIVCGICDNIRNLMRPRPTTSGYVPKKPPLHNPLVPLYAHPIRAPAADGTLWTGRTGGSGGLAALYRISTGPAMKTSPRTG